MSRGFRKVRALFAMLTAIAATGCAHQVSFEDASYQTGAKQQAASVVAVIDKATLENTVAIRSFMTGVANSWEVQPGDMLKQVIDIELPQMFANYEFSTTEKQPSGSGPGMILGFKIPNYAFADFHANISVHVVAKDRNGAQLFEKTYEGQGDTQGGKMFWGGAFAMKSAIRQSSLDAYKQIFVKLREDLDARNAQSTAARTQ